MDVKLLKQADYVLSKCGRPVAPAGLSVVYIPHSVLLQSVVPVASQVTATKEIEGDCTWCLRAISSSVSATTALFVQIQLPDGKFLVNALMDVVQIAGFGSYRYLFSRELPCPPGSKIQITFDTSTPAAASAQPIVLLFEGAFAYYLRGGERAYNVEEFASVLPRILNTTGQNILAPCWMSGEGPRTPDGYEDSRFIYSSSVVTIALAGPQLTASTQVQIQQASDFECRRLLFDVTASSGAVTAGSFLVRVRLASGYSLTDTYMDLPRLLGSAQWAKDWHCPAGDAVVLDFLLVDGAGSGSMSIQVHLDGVRRRKVGA